MRSYEIEVLKNGEPVTVSLRLTLKGQMNLKKQYNENALTTIFGGMDDVRKMLAVFKEALNYKDNENTIKDGEELYDLIVDADMGGVSGFQKILTGIARESGLLTEKEMETLNKKAETFVEDAFSDEDDAKNVVSLPLSKE